MGASVKLENIPLGDGNLQVTLLHGDRGDFDNFFLYMCGYGSFTLKVIYPEIVTFYG